MTKIKEGYKDSEIGVIPVGWEVVRLEGITKITMGQSPKSDTYNTDNIGIPLIQGNADCKNRKTIPRTYTTDLTKECFIGDIIMTVRAPVGAISKSLHNACIGRGVCSIKSKEDNEYIYHCLVDYEDRWDKLSQGSTFTAVSGSDIKNLKFPLPPLKEQEKIADILSTADDKIDAITIQIEKAQTLKKGLLQKLLSEGINHCEFKDSELGKIPESWKVVDLDNVAKLNKQKYTPIQSENLNYIGLEHINQEQGTIKGVGNSNDTLSQKNCFNKGEILFGKLRPYLRKFYLAEIDGVCSTEILVIKAKDNILNSILFQIIKTETFIEHSVSKVFGTKMPRTSWAILQEFRLALPPLKEQKQIADILSTADEKLEVLRAKKEKYETLKKGLLQKLLSGEVRV